MFPCPLSPVPLNPHTIVRGLLTKSLTCSSGCPTCWRPGKSHPRWGCPPPKLILILLPSRWWQPRVVYILWEGPTPCTRSWRSWRWCSYLPPCCWCCSGQLLKVADLDKAVSLRSVFVEIKDLFGYLGPLHQEHNQVVTLACILKFGGG